MDMRAVAEQKGASLPKKSRHTVVHVISREPVHLVDLNLQVIDRPVADVLEPERLPALREWGLRTRTEIPRNGLTKPAAPRISVVRRRDGARNRVGGVRTCRRAVARGPCSPGGRGSLEIDDDEGGLEGGPVDLIQDRIFRHVSDDGQTWPT